VFVAMYLFKWWRVSLLSFELTISLIELYERFVKEEERAGLIKMCCSQGQVADDNTEQCSKSQRRWRLLCLEILGRKSAKVFICIQKRGWKEEQLVG
jgi:hypothetical protein